MKAPDKYTFEQEQTVCLMPKIKINQGHLFSLRELQALVKRAMDDAVGDKISKAAAPVIGREEAEQAKDFYLDNTFCLLDTNHYRDQSFVLKVFYRQEVPKEEYDRKMAEYRIVKEHGTKKAIHNEAQRLVQQHQKTMKLFEQLDAVEGKIAEIKANEKIPVVKKLELLNKFQAKLQALQEARPSESCQEETKQLRALMTLIQAETELMEAALINLKAVEEQERFKAQYEVRARFEEDDSSFPDNY